MSGTTNTMVAFHGDPTHSVAPDVRERYARTGRWS